MIVVRADAMGMCFGVRDALDVAFSHPRPDEVAIHGELVHNEAVRRRLRAAGFEELGERTRAARDSARPAVLVTAHGVSDRERLRLETAGKRVVDTTCPLVRRAHDAAVELARDGRHVLVIGKPGHVEVEGLVGDLPSFDVIPDVEHVTRYPRGRLGVVCQTTCPVAHADAVRAAIRSHNPTADIRFVDTICEPTKQRVRAVLELARSVDRVVVVGGRSSNNTARLVDLARAQGTPTVHVTEAAELEAAEFVRDEIVGLTAGTSTPPWIVDAVEQALRAMR